MPAERLRRGYSHAPGSELAGGLRARGCEIVLGQRMGYNAGKRLQGQEAPTGETLAAEWPEGVTDVLGAEDLRNREAGCAR